MAGLGKKLAVWKKVGRFRKKSWQVREKVGRSAEKVGRLLKDADIESSQLVSCQKLAVCGYVGRFIYITMT